MATGTPHSLTWRCAGYGLVLTACAPGTSAILPEPDPVRLRALGAVAARISSVKLTPAPALPVRSRPIEADDFAGMRRDQGASDLLHAAELAVAGARPGDDRPGLVHGDLWHGNTLWDGDDLTAVLDWDCAGVGPAGIDLGSLRCDAAWCHGVEAAGHILRGWEAQDDLGPFGAGPAGGLQPDARAAADDDDGLAEQFRLAPGDSGTGCGGHDSPPVTGTGGAVAAGSGQGMAYPGTGARGAIRPPGWEPVLRLSATNSAVTCVSPSVVHGAASPPGRGLWKRAQTPIWEHAMATIRLHQTTTATPGQFLAGLTDFGPGRSNIFPNSADGYLKVHEQGPDWADVTEGSKGVWERLRYDWSDPRRITMTTTDSNLWGRRSGHTYTLTLRPGGTTLVDAVVVREGKNLKGRLFEILLAAGGKRVLGSALAKTVKAIEARNRQASVENV